MTKYNVQINLDKPQRVFYNGDVLKGTVYLNLNEKLRFKAISVALIGIGNVKWYDPKYNRTWRAKKQYLNVSQIVCCECELDTGEYSFSFQFTLPDCLPPSYEHSNGKVRYYILTTVENPSSCFNFNQKRGLDKKLIKTISVIRHMDLNLWPGLREHIETSDISKQFHFGPLSTGNEVLTKFKISKNGFVPGESISFNVTIDNHSRKTLIKINVQLIQHLEVHEKRHDKQYKHKIFELLYPNNIEAGSCSTWQGQLPIPAVCQSFDSSLSKLIDLTYSVVLFFDCEFSLSKEVAIPITIGTCPARNIEDKMSTVYENATYKRSEIVIEDGNHKYRNKNFQFNNCDDEVDDNDDNDDEEFKPLYLFYPRRKI